MGGAVSIGRTVYFIPCSLNIIGIYNVDQKIFSTLELNVVTSTGCFTLFEVINKKIILLFVGVQDNTMIILDTETNIISQLNSPLGSGNKIRDFQGSCLVKNQLYLSPY